MRLPTEARFIAQIEGSIRELELVRANARDLLRRRAHEAGRDGFPSSSMGGSGSSGGTPSSSTETAALGGKLPDPVGDKIDTIIEAIKSTSDTMGRAGNCLRAISTGEQEARGRQTAVTECDCCSAPITLVGDDRKRRGFCNACYKAWERWRAKAPDPTASIAFIKGRQQYLKDKAASPVP